MKRTNLTGKTLIIAGLSLSMVGGLTSCKKEGCTDSTATNYDEKAKKDDGSCEYPTPVTPTPTTPTQGAETKTGKITADETWTANNIYTLNGKVVVEDGVTLTIEPGTVIKGEAGTGANATALLVARGAKLMAEGTASLPIIFTSVADEITPEDIAAGNFASPNLDPTVNGYWGGVIVLGNAPISASNDADADVTEVQIEGIPTSDQNGLYGGSDAADNSGSLAYISIRHGGSNIGSGNEINGLSLGGVGSGTTIDNIEIVANQDDGIEWYGGTVECTNMITWNVGDDGLDTDQSWGGSCTNYITVTAAGHAFELDGPEGSMEDSHTFTNGSVIASNDDVATQDLINTDDNSMVAINNLFITAIVDGQVIDTDGQGAGVTFDNVLLDVADVTAHTKSGAAVTGVSEGTTSQADASAFSWTWTHAAGVISGL